MVKKFGILDKQTKAKNEKGFPLVILKIEPRRKAENAVDKHLSNFNIRPRPTFFQTRRALKAKKLKQSI